MDAAQGPGVDRGTPPGGERTQPVRGLGDRHDRGQGRARGHRDVGGADHGLPADGEAPRGKEAEAWPMWSLSCCCPTRIGCTRLPPTTGASSSVTGASPGGCRRGSISPIPMRPGSGA